jgi:hypothetical protein
MNIFQHSICTKEMTFKHDPPVLFCNAIVQNLTGVVKLYCFSISIKSTVGGFCPSCLPSKKNCTVLTVEDEPRDAMTITIQQQNWFHNFLLNHCAYRPTLPMRIGMQFWCNIHLDEGVRCMVLGRTIWEKIKRNRICGVI